MSPSMGGDAERDVACWYLSRREADPRASIVRPVHLERYADAWTSACNGGATHIALDVPGLTAERVAAAEKALVAAWSRRHASQALKRATAALEAGGEPGAIEADVSRALAEAASGGLVRSETHHDVAIRVLRSWMAGMAEQPRMIPVPWKALQDHTGGLPLGKIVMLGGRSSEHKTTTARELAEGAARHFATLEAGHALYWTMEDASADVAGRTVADNVSAITTRDLLTGTHKGKRPTMDAAQRIEQEARSHLAEPWTKRLRLIDEATPTIGRVLSVLSAEASRGCKMAVLDFFHLIRPDKGEMRPDVARQIATDLHAAAKTHDMSLLILGQLDKTSTLESAEQHRVPFAAEMLYGSMLKQTSFGCIMVGLTKDRDKLIVVVEKWKASDANVSFRLRVDPAHDRLLDE